MDQSTHIPAIGLFDFDQSRIEALGPVIQFDRNGFFYCRRGRLQLVLDGRTYEIREGDIYIYPPFSQTYICEVGDHVEGVVGVADFDFVLSTFMSVSNTQNYIYARENPCISLDDVQRSRIEELIGTIRRRKPQPAAKTLQQTADPVHAHLLSALGQALCYEIMLAYFSNYPIQPLKQTRKDKIFQSFLFALHSHFRTRHDVAFYAELQCLTPRYFSTIIREQSNRTALQWIAITVVAEAKKMLSLPDKSIKEIANTLGFANQSFFGRYFKQYAGMSPSEWRRMK